MKNSKAELHYITPRLRGHTSLIWNIIQTEGKLTNNPNKENEYTGGHLQLIDHRINGCVSYSEPKCY
jgi:hypothetical protein